MTETIRLETHDRCVEYYIERGKDGIFELHYRYADNKYDSIAEMHDDLRDAEWELKLFPSKTLARAYVQVLLQEG